MFPIPWNRAYRKKDGSLVTIDDAMSGGGGGAVLPDYSIEDAGKVLGVDDDGNLAWVTVSGTSNFGRASSPIIGYELPITNAKEAST